MDLDFIHKNFFVISTDNFLNTQSRLYGYAIFDKKIYINGSVNDIPTYSDGAYINVTKQANKIYIQQDYNGSYGLYLFQKDNYFAVSNSFLYLLNYLKEREFLSLNLDYTKYFVTEYLCSLSISETLINEIKLLPNNISITIDLATKNLNIKNTIKEEEKISLDSEIGIKILDNWYYKWCNVLIGLQNKSELVQVDLSGGMDSRATFSIFNHKKVNFNHISVRSTQANHHTFNEDYKIASAIAERLGFKLNKILDTNAYFISNEISMNISFLTKLGFHKQMAFKKAYNKKRIFCFTGFGGETIRVRWDNDESFIKEQISLDNFFTVDFKKSIYKILDSSFKLIRNSSGDNSSLMKKLYQNTWLRSHFGKTCVENLLINTYSLNPLMDRELQKISTNDNLLIHVIYDRYLKEINDIEFDGNRKLDNNLLEKAKKINSNYKFQDYDYDYNFDIIDNTDTTTLPNNSRESPNAKLSMLDIFHSNKIKNSIIDLFGSEIYQRAELNLSRLKHFPEALACALTAIALVDTSINLKNNLLNLTKNNKDKIDKNPLLPKLLEICKTARIDIRNNGKYNNRIKFEQQNGVKIKTPNWLKSNNCIGYTIESSLSKLYLKFQCIGDGYLTISLKSIDIRDYKNDRFPLYINYNSCKINNNEQIREKITVCHDNPYIINRPVKNNDIIELSVEWDFYDYDKENFIKLLENLFDVIPYNFEKY